jgi:hypothetical protein
MSHIIPISQNFSLRGNRPVSNHVTPHVRSALCQAPEAVVLSRFAIIAYDNVAPLPFSPGSKLPFIWAKFVQV